MGEVVTWSPNYSLSAPLHYTAQQLSFSQRCQYLPRHFFPRGRPLAEWSFIRTLSGYSSSPKSFFSRVFACDSPFPFVMAAEDWSYRIDMTAMAKDRIDNIAMYRQQPRGRPPKRRTDFSIFVCSPSSKASPGLWGIDSWYYFARWLLPYFPLLRGHEFWGDMLLFRQLVLSAASIWFSCSHPAFFFFGHLCSSLALFRFWLRMLFVIVQSPSACFCILSLVDAFGLFLIVALLEVLVIRWYRRIHYCINFAVSGGIVITFSLYGCLNNCCHLNMKSNQYLRGFVPYNVDDSKPSNATTNTCG